MSTSSLSVKTFPAGAGWGYRVVNGGGSALITRRGYDSEAKARESGHAAANALAPIRQPFHYLQPRETKRRALRIDTAQLKSLLR